MIIGRKNEIKQLDKAYHSNKAQFLAIYGRRRVGKTFLVREYFENQDCHFLHVTGLKKGNMRAQLKKFTEALSATFYKNTKLVPPKNWEEAFGMVLKQINDTQKKVVIFLDELPWLATKKSGLLTELDYSWNRDWSVLPQVILIVCGSSASWLIKKIINNQGGLHNRITAQINLKPFSLAETNEYLSYNGIKLNQKHVMEIYMALGGIPYYLEYLDVGESAKQNIQRIFFGNSAPLKDEYNRLFDSLFENAEAYKELIALISQKNIGIGMAELAKKATLSTSGGRMSERLEDLCAAGFIEKYIPWGAQKVEYYKLIDEFCLFYLRWVVPQNGEQLRKDYWISQSQLPAYHSWSGYAFEAVCMKHIHQIADALHIPARAMSSWRYIPAKNASDRGAQVDLVIDRWDDALNLCEIKYTEQPFTIDKKYAEKLRRVIEVFRKQTNLDKVIFLSMISANGLKETIYSEDMVNGVVSLKDLFKS